MNLLQSLLNTVLPVFLLAGLGWVARKLLHAEVKDLAKISVYFLTPGLVANSILNAGMVAGEVGKVIAFGLLLTAIMILLTLALGRLLGWSPVERNAAVLSTSFLNAANYGLPIVLFAFGQAGFDRATVFVVLESLLMYTLAAFIAARGKQTWRQALQAVARLPLAWAALAALALRGLGITLPAMVMKPIGLLASTAPVILIIILGMQVAGIQLKGNLGKIGLATLLRLVASPLVAMALVWWLRPEPLTGQVLILESAMPASVNVTLLAVQFDAEPEQVSSVTLVSTLLSLVTLTVWVTVLR